MITFHIITLFPELIELYCSTSVIGRGMKEGKIALKTYNPRDFCLDKYRKVDDSPYGGGAGMVLKPEPFFAAFESIKRSPGSPVLLMTPQGTPLKQNLAQLFADRNTDSSAKADTNAGANASAGIADSNSASNDITIFCGHYEGFDERIRSIATHEISIGDFVLTGGELPSLILIDAIGRLVPGVIGKSISLAHESFVENLLEGPQYTKPPEFRGMAVPEVLRSGDHQAIAKWRRREVLKRTYERRPDLLDGANLNAEDHAFLKSLGYSP